MFLIAHYCDIQMNQKNSDCLLEGEATLIPPKKTFNVLLSSRFLLEFSVIDSKGTLMSKWINEFNVIDSNEVSVMDSNESVW